MSGVLYVVGTPIGNLEDLSIRAARMLSSVDRIAAEDTRMTKRLTDHLGISKKLFSVHEHSREGSLRQVLDRLKTGESVAYVSDAGTPGVNDPGGKLVERCFAEGIKVEPIPGASALTTAISVCGFPMNEFVYIGFIPHKKGRATLFRQIVERKEPTIFFESTHRIMKTLDDLAAALSLTRLLFCGRELTKLHETLYRGTVQEVKRAVQATSAKGEFVCIVGPKK